MLSERKKKAFHLCSRMGLSSFFFGICERLDVFDICVTGQCSSSLALKPRCPYRLCVRVCTRTGLCLHIRAAKHRHRLKKKPAHKHTHKLAPFLIPIASVMRYILTPTMSVCQVVSLFLSLSFYASTLSHSPSLARPFPPPCSFLSSSLSGL